MSVRWPCVRCGVNARYDGTYLCSACLTSPVTRWEAGHVDELDGLTARRRLMAEYGWYGAWDHSTRPVVPATESELAAAFGDH